MRVSVFSSKPYDRSSLASANALKGGGTSFLFLETHLDARTASLAEGSGAACVFVNDHLDRDVLERLARAGVRLVALRSAGFNNVDLPASRDLGITVARVPKYSPHAVAEHTVGLILSLNRKLHRAFTRVRDGNFSLDGLLGFEELLGSVDIVSLHCPLTPATHHLIDAEALDRMKPGVMLINTGRGALVDTAAVMSALKSGQVGALGLDVYEEEEGLFFEDLSGTIIQDDVFMRLLTFPNVMVTAHQAFFTEDALRAIAETTIANITAFETGSGEIHRVGA